MGPCDATRDHLALLAIGDPTARLTPDLIDHLARCPGCRDEYAALFDASGLLAFGVRQVAPPAHLRDRIMAAVRAEREAVRGSTGADGPSPSVAPDRVDGRRPLAGPRTGSSGRRGPGAASGRSRAGWAVAAALLFAANCGWVGVLLGMRSERGAWERRAAVSEARLADLGGLMVGGKARRFATLSLSGTAQAPQASGRVVVYVAAGEAYVVLHVAGLPPTEGRQAYQAWLVHDGQRTNAGTFQVSRNGQAVLVYITPGEPAFEALGVTLEPDEKGRAPRGPRVLGGEMPKDQEASKQA